MPSTPVSDQVGEVPIPALLRAARGAYGRAVGARLAAGHFSDVPRNGPFVLGGMAAHGVDAVQLIRQLGVSKQAASQLIDQLVLGGYLRRETNPEDRRRVAIELTERGHEAAEAVREGVRAVNAELAELTSPTELDGMRAGLVALCDIRDRLEDEARAGVAPG
jgi:DNA-binding MarR family transcriptional regulator